MVVVAVVFLLMCIGEGSECSTVIVDIIVVVIVVVVVMQVRRIHSRTHPNIHIGIPRARKAIRRRFLAASHVSGEVRSPEESVDIGIEIVIEIKGCVRQ